MGDGIKNDVGWGYCLILGGLNDPSEEAASRLSPKEGEWIALGISEGRVCQAEGTANAKAQRKKEA